jgi:hypothetical protein
MSSDMAFFRLIVLSFAEIFEKLPLREQIIFLIAVILGMIDIGANIGSNREIIEYSAKFF